jgi:hypothetical protein
MQKSATEPVVDNLKKITLSITAGTSAQKSDIIDHPQTFTFIFGLRPDGLTPFEYALAGKSSGAKICLQLKSVELNRIFRHINLPFTREFDDHTEFFLAANITAVETANSREVVQAMAAMAGCDSNCDCGCGCG